MTDNSNRSGSETGGSGQMGQSADRANQMGQQPGRQAQGAAGRQQSGQMGAGSGAGQQQQFEGGDAGRFRDQLREHMEVIGADGTHVGTIDCVKEDRLILTRGDSTDRKHHALPLGLIAGIEDGKVRLTANGDVAHYGFEDAEEGADWSGESNTGATATDTQTGSWSSTPDSAGTGQPSGMDREGGDSGRAGTDAEH